MKAQLACGAIIDVTLREGTNIIEFGVAPAEGTKIEDFTFVKDGVLRINMTLDSFLGLHEMFNMMVRKKQKWYNKLGL